MQVHFLSAREDIEKAVIEAAGGIKMFIPARIRCNGPVTILETPSRRAAMEIIRSLAEEQNYGLLFVQGEDGDY